MLLEGTYEYKLLHQISAAPDEWLWLKKGF